MGRGKSIDLFLMDETRAKKNNTVIINSNGGQPKTWLWHTISSNSQHLAEMQGVLLLN